MKGRGRGREKGEGEVEERCELTASIILLVEEGNTNTHLLNGFSDAVVVEEGRYVGGG